MKKYALITAALLGVSILSTAQSGLALGPQADTVASRIARKMKDTLDLTGAQRNQIYQKNVLLHHRKDSIRQLYPPGSDSLRIKIQRIENRRDSLYRSILGEEKFQLYLQKKRNLVSAN